MNLYESKKYYLSVLGFSDTMTTLMMTIYLALDGYGPAVNVSGDGAITVITDAIFRNDDKK